MEKPDLFKRLEGLMRYLEEHKLSTKAILNAEETARYMGISKSAVYKLTSQRKLEHFCPSGKLIFFKRSSIDEFLLRNRIPTEDEIKSGAYGYLTGKRK
ncbi:hypothetical protein TH63_13565 [Rufibacter radiotolerans]|uniref:Helix-turn-helix domain-containing protein n=1 Tax=Rufibacter radiotolerans TaxID=1379910 RepID=A0A0H4VRL0_9BACT|nr:helix-turn-helix domain-containing protein [Rufibacter radiotolerans]AKQ46419.1 hypothetical protein TH63_13565 [Rufibacter radiotolerans]